MCAIIPRFEHLKCGLLNIFLLFAISSAQDFSIYTIQKNRQNLRHIFQFVPNTPIY